MQPLVAMRQLQVGNFWEWQKCKNAVNLYYNHFIGTTMCNAIMKAQFHSLMLREDSLAPHFNMLGTLKHIFFSMCSVHILYIII